MEKIEKLAKEYAEMMLNSFDTNQMSGLENGFIAGYEQAVEDIALKEAMKGIREEEEKITADFFRDYKIALSKLEIPSFVLKDSLRENETSTSSGFCRLPKPFKDGCYKINIEGVELIVEEQQEVYYGDDANETEHKYCIYIRQTCGVCGDDYSGHILFPLKNDEFWIIGYSC